MARCINSQLGLIALLFVASCLAQRASSVPALRGESPGRVRLSQILFGTPKPYIPKQVDEAGRAATEVLYAIRKGAKFEHVSLGPAYPHVTMTLSNLGYFSRSDLPAESEKLVFSMKLGDVSDVLRTEEGFVILKVTGFEESDVPDESPPSTAEASGTGPLDLRAWIAIGAAFGTLVTALINFVRWWRERSIAHKIREQTGQISDLLRLVETLPQMNDAVGALSGELADKARRALSESAGGLVATLDRDSNLGCHLMARWHFSAGGFCCSDPVVFAQQLLILVSTPPWSRSLIQFSC